MIPNLPRSGMMSPYFKIIKDYIMTACYNDYTIIIN